jgi:hypothetical protein
MGTCFTAQMDYSIVCNQNDLQRNYRLHFQVKAVESVSHEEVHATFLYLYSAYYPYFGEKKLAYESHCRLCVCFYVSACVPSLTTFEHQQRFS